LQLLTDRWAETGVGTNSGVTVTHLANQLLTHVPIGIQVSGDAAAVVTIESPASTVLWRQRFSAAFDRAYSFPLGALQGAAGGALLVKISASTSNCEANMQGVSVLVGTFADLNADGYAVATVG
jgi:hypothetical protein